MSGLTYVSSTAYDRRYEVVADALASAWLLENGDENTDRLGDAIAAQIRELTTDCRMSRMAVLSANGRLVEYEQYHRRISEDRNFLSRITPRYMERRPTGPFLPFYSILLQFPQLCKLHLCDACIEAIPAEIGRLTLLVDLEITGGTISTLPEELFGLPLQRLVLDLNLLTELPAMVANLQELTHLSLKFNRLTTLPHTRARCEEALTRR